jgi:hypothetical protein
LAGLRPWQPKADHDALGRRVPASLLAAPVAPRLHAYPQLRLPCQPPSRRASPPLFPAAGRRSDLNTDYIDPTAGACILELPSLRRNYAACRTPVRRSTAAAISAPFPLVRSMKPHLQARPTHVLQHAQPSCASSTSGPTLALRFTPARISTRCSHLCYRPLHPHDTDSNDSFASPTNPLNCIQIP